MSKVAISLIALNAVGFAAFSLTWLSAAYLLPMSGRSAVTALDRAGAFDSDKLAAAYPQLAQNLRNNVGDFVTEGSRSAARGSACLGAIVCAANLVVLGFAAQRRTVLGWTRRQANPAPLHSEPSHLYSPSEK